MLNWVADTLLVIVNFVPALFVAEESQHYTLVRTMITLILIVLIIPIIAMLRRLVSSFRAMRTSGRV